MGWSPRSQLFLCVVLAGVSLLFQYKLQPVDLALKWEAYTVNSATKGVKPTVAELEKFKSYLTVGHVLRSLMIVPHAHRPTVHPAVPEEGREEGTSRGL